MGQEQSEGVFYRMKPGDMLQWATFYPIHTQSHTLTCSSRYGCVSCTCTIMRRSSSVLDMKMCLRRASSCAIFQRCRSCRKSIK